MKICNKLHTTGMWGLMVCSSTEAGIDGVVSCRLSGCIENLSEEDEAFGKTEACDGSNVVRSISKFKDSTEPSRTDELEISKP